MRNLILLLAVLGVIVSAVGCGSGDADPQKAAEIRAQQMKGETAEDKAGHD